MLQPSRFSLVKLVKQEEVDLLLVSSRGRVMQVYPVLTQGRPRFDHNMTPGLPRTVSAIQAKTY